MDSADLGGPEPKGMDADERREMVVDRRQMLKRAGLGAAALAVPAAVMATPSMGAVDGRARRRQLHQVAPEVEVRLRQPRDDEPVLRPDDLRSAGRVLAPWHQLPVDGLNDLRHQPDGERDERGDHGQGRRHRGLPRIADGVQRPDEPRAGQGHPGPQLQRRCTEQPAGLHRSGSLPVRLQHGPAGRRPRRQRRRGALHRHAGPAQHPAPHRRSASPRSRSSARARSRRRRRPPGAASPTSWRRSRPTTSVTRTSRGCSPSTPARRRASARSCRSTASRRRASRPAATTWGRPSSRRSRRGTWTSRSTSSPTCRVGSPSSSSSSTSTRRGSLHRRTRTPASLFVTKANVKPYLTTKTRYEGSSSKQKYPVTQKG